MLATGVTVADGTLLSLLPYLVFRFLIALASPRRHVPPSGECNYNMLPIQCSVCIELSAESCQNGRTDCVDSVNNIAVIVRLLRILTLLLTLLSDAPHAGTKLVCQ